MPRSVHFVAHHGQEDAISRYRCANFASQLSSKGWKTDFTNIHGDGVVEITADIVVMNRVLFTPRMGIFISELKSAGKAVVFGVDDFVFDNQWVEKECSEATPATVSNVRREIAGYAQALRKTLMACDCALVSTQFLRYKVSELSKPAYVLRNTLPEDLWRISEAAQPPRDEHKVVLGYFSGTKTHGRDFQTVEAPLKSFLNQNPRAEILVVGGVPISSELRRVAGARLIEKPTVPWRELPALIAGVDINLAPLDLRFPFNLGKSHLKWLEAAAVGVPTVAARTEEFQSSIREGVDGFTAAGDNDWLSALERLSADKFFRETIGSEAKRKADTVYRGINQAGETLGVFEEIAESFAQPQSSGSVSLALNTGLGGAVRRLRGSVGAAVRSVRLKGHR